MKAPSALLIVPAALLGATLAVAVPSWDLELTELEELAHTRILERDDYPRTVVTSVHG